MEGATAYEIRADLQATHARIRQHIAAPGTWWSAEQRLQIAAEVREARSCEYCRERKDALSPTAVNGAHATQGKLPTAIVDLVHRIVTDPGRLSKSFVHGLFSADEIAEEPYVELVSVVVLVNALDVFDRALGAPQHTLPAPQPGEPTRERHGLALEDGAWVRLVPTGEAAREREIALYQGIEQVPNIGRALSLVQAELVVMHQLSEPHYMALPNVSNPAYETPGRAIDRLQMELVASRVSRMNDCFY